MASTDVSATSTGNDAASTPSRTIRLNPDGTHAPAGKPIKILSGYRYDQLLGYIAAKPSLRILEIGVAQARNAMRMMAFADCLGGKPQYVGVDLFGSLTEELFDQEIRTAQKRPKSRAETMDLLRDMLGDEIALRMMLLEGFSGEVLSELCNAKMQFDLIFIDGGHSYDVVRDDWQKSQQLLAPGGVIVFDDYPNYGVGRVVHEIDPGQWKVRVLEMTDRFQNIFPELDPSPELDFQLVQVLRRAG